MESMKNVLQLLCAVLFVMAMSAETVRADLLAYEGFNYETNHVGSLNGLSGGAPVSDYGWASGWSHEFYSSKDDNSRIALGSSTRDGVRSTGNRAVFFRKFARNLASPVRKTQGTLWISFFYGANTSKATSSFEFLDSARTNGAPVTVTVSGRSVIFMNGVGTGVTASTAVRFFLFCVNFSETGNTVSLWLNPDVTSGSAPTTEPHATCTTEDNWGVTGIRFTNNSGFTNTYTVDELRFGDEARDVYKLTAPNAATVLILK